MSTTGPSIPTNAPEVQARDLAELRARDERLTAFYRKHWAALDHESWYDAIRDAVGESIRSKAEHELHVLAGLVRQEKDSNALYGLAQRIDLAQTILEVCGLIADAEASTRASIFENHEIVDPNELATLRLKAEAFDADVARRQAAEAEMKAKHEAEKAPRSRKLRLVKPAPKSKRAPVSSRGVRRAS